MKINLGVDLNIEQFSGSGVTDYNSGATNSILNKRGERVIATQRPSIDITEDSTTVTTVTLNDRGRGIYYWENNSKKYIVHDDSVYSVTQNSIAVGTITAGSERVTMLETIGTPKLVILDAENDKGWVMSAAESVTQIDTTGSTGFFPTTLCHGGAILNGTLYACDEDGIIYNSDVDDPTVFGASSFVKAERENDKGVYLGKHHDNLVYFGTRSMEFFYDAGNAVGSPLNRRQDISYNIGCASGLSVWENGDIIYFLGSNREGQIQVYKLENFQLKPISTDAINSYVTQGLTQSGLVINCSGLSAMGHDTLLMTVYILSGSSILPKITLSYDSVSSKWGFWETSLNGNTTFPLMAWTKRTGGQNATVAARTGEGIMYNGDIIAINDNMIPVDTIHGSGGVYESGVYELDVYVSNNTNVGSNIDWIVRTGLIDGGTTEWKFQSKETVVMENTPSTQTMTIKHSSESSNNFDAGNTVDTSDDRKEVYQSDRFMKRNYQLEYSGYEQIFAEVIDVVLEAGI